VLNRGMKRCSPKIDRFQTQERLSIGPIGTTICPVLVAFLSKEALVADGDKMERVDALDERTDLLRPGCCNCRCASSRGARKVTRAVSTAAPE